MSTPNLRALSKYSVNRPGAVEVIRQRLYDHVLLAGAGTTQLQFFQNPIGQGVTTAQGAAVGTAKTRADTNLELAGQLPAYKNFVIESIELTFLPGLSSVANTFTPSPYLVSADPAAIADVAAINESADDVRTFYSTGWGVLFIGSKEFLVEAPLGAFPPKVRVDFQAAVCASGAPTDEGYLVGVKGTPGGRPYFVQPQITIPSGQNFSFTCNWPGLVAMPSGFNARVGCILDGYLYRNSQ